MGFDYLFEADVIGERELYGQLAQAVKRRDQIWGEFQGFQDMYQRLLGSKQKKAELDTKVAEVRRTHLHHGSSFIHILRTNSYRLRKLTPLLTRFSQRLHSLAQLLHLISTEKS